jgi:flagellar basal-body rod protein FlgF
MNRGIYATASGMLAGQKWMDVVSQNLANVSTTGYKRNELAFSDRLVREMRTNGGRGQHVGSLGSGAALIKEYTVFEQGPVQSTGNPLDVAIASDKGLFKVETPQGVRYTRDGGFGINTQRELVTRSGFKVLDPSGSPIELPEEEFNIAPNGAIMAGGQEVARIGVYDGTFTKAGNNLFEGVGVTVIDEPSLKPAALEGSNVNAVEAMIQMISVNRAFEMAQKSITQQDELTQRLISSLQDR